MMTFSYFTTLIHSTVGCLQPRLDIATRSESLHQAIIAIKPKHEAKPTSSLEKIRKIREKNLPSLGKMLTFSLVVFLVPALPANVLFPFFHVVHWHETHYCKFNHSMRPFLVRFLLFCCSNHHKIFQLGKYPPTRIHMCIKHFFSTSKNIFFPFLSNNIESWRYASKSHDI